MGCHRFLFWGGIDCTSSLGETVFKKDAGVLESVQHRCPSLKRNFQGDRMKKDLVISKPVCSSNRESGSLFWGKVWRQERFFFT